jgi:hypothetical protein
MVLIRVSLRCVGSLVKKFLLLGFTSDITWSEHQFIKKYINFTLQIGCLGLY